VSTLQEILDDANLNGVYRIETPIPELAGLVRLDARAWADKDALLAALGFALEFPDYYGVNWDALEECLFDLSWWHGPVYVLIEHAEALSHEDLVILADVWGEAAAAWAELDRGCVLLLQGAGPADLPLL
jgi:RNAse (barnase) inhibitor barstar